MTFSPHKLVQVPSDVVCVTTFHSLQLRLDSIPVQFHMLCVDVSDWINKVDGVFHATKLKELLLTPLYAHHLLVCTTEPGAK